MAMRLKAMGQPQYQDVVDENGWTGKVGCNLEAMKVPGKGKLVFCQSMGDLFYEGVTDEQRAAVFAMMYLQAHKEHAWQVLTKRPQAAFDWYCKLRDGKAGMGNSLKLLGFDGMWARLALAGGMMTNAVGQPPYKLPSNLWFGWTAEDQRRMDERTPFGLRIPAAVRFVSMEPLIGPISMLPYFADIRCSQCGWLGYGDNDTPDGGLAKEYDGPGDEDGHWECPNCGASEEGCVCDYSPVHDPYGPDPRIDWVIVGCESGPNRRPCETRWVADVLRQCSDAGVLIFVKQLEIDGEVVHDAGRIALELSGYVGRPLCVEDIRQWPKGFERKS